MEDYNKYYEFLEQIAYLNLEDANENSKTNPNQAIEDYKRGIKYLMDLIEYNYFNGQNREQVMVKIESYLRITEEIKQKLKIIKPEREVEK